MATIAEEGFVVIEEDLEERVLDMEIDDSVEEKIPGTVGEMVVSNSEAFEGIAGGESLVSSLQNENEWLRTALEDVTRKFNHLQEEHTKMREEVEAKVDEEWCNWYSGGSAQEEEEYREQTEMLPEERERDQDYGNEETNGRDQRNGGDRYPRVSNGTDSKVNPDAWNEPSEGNRGFENQQREHSRNEEHYRERNERGNGRYQQGDNSEYFGRGNRAFERDEVRRGNTQRNDDRWEHEQYHHGDDGYGHHREARTEADDDDASLDNGQVEGERYERADEDNRRLNQNQWNRFGSLLDRPPVSGTGSRISIERWLQLPIYTRKLAHDGGKAPSKKCTFCQEWRHFPADCPRYPTLEQRLRRARELGLCVNCLRYHRGSHCGHLNACFKCTIGRYNGWDKHHHQAICPFNF